MPECRGDGDRCPNCDQGTLRKPRGAKARCPWCKYVVNGRNNGTEMKDFDISYRQAKRLLDVFGYDPHGTPGDIGTRLRQFCHDEDIAMSDLNGLLRDLRSTQATARDRSVQGGVVDD